MSRTPKTRPILRSVAARANRLDVLEAYRVLDPDAIGSVHAEVGGCLTQHEAEGAVGAGKYPQRRKPRDRLSPPLKTDRLDRMVRTGTRA